MNDNSLLQLYKNIFFFGVKEIAINYFYNLKNGHEVIV